MKMPNALLAVLADLGPSTLQTLPMEQLEQTLPHVTAQYTDVFSFFDSLSSLFQIDIFVQQSSSRRRN